MHPLCYLLMNDPCLYCYDRYRGASPIQYALLNGDRETGVSIIDVHPSIMDGGRILAQTRSVSVSYHHYTWFTHIISYHTI
jgi:folate-dependent phosphoribosylglycinamide formyltransferase PurN